MGLGPIEPFLDDPTVNEVMVNGSDHIYVERSGVIERPRARFISEEHLRRVIERIVTPVGRRVDEASPMVDARSPMARVSTSSSRRCRWTARSSPSASSPRTRSRSTTWSPWARSPSRWRRCWPAPSRGHEHPRLRRYRYRQDDDAQRAVGLRPERRAHRHHRGRRRAPAAPGPRDPLEARPPNIEGHGEITIRDLVATPCACVPTASSSARSAAPRRSTCSRP